MLANPKGWEGGRRTPNVSRVDPVKSPTSVRVVVDPTMSDRAGNENVTSRDAGAAWPKTVVPSMSRRETADVGGAVPISSTWSEPTETDWPRAVSVS